MGIRPMRRVRAALVAIVVGIASAVTVVPALTSAAHATTSPYSVFVGYADTVRANPANFPTPWNGDAGVDFQGCTGSCEFDGGAVEVVNNTGKNLSVDSIQIQFT